MIGWVKQLNAAFGASFLWLICLIYFTQVPILHLCLSLSLLAKKGCFVQRIYWALFYLFSFAVSGTWRSVNSRFWFLGGSLEDIL
jgi:hypothetical protein